jgi:hypothetical protein
MMDAPSQGVTRLNVSKERYSSHSKQQPLRTPIRLEQSYIDKSVRCTWREICGLHQQALKFLRFSGLDCPFDILRIESVNIVPVPRTNPPPLHQKQMKTPGLWHRL